MAGCSERARFLSPLGRDAPAASAAPDAVRSFSSSSVALGGRPCSGVSLAGRSLSGGRGRGSPWGGGDAHFPRWALYPRVPRPRRLPLGDDSMCGLVSESALHRARRGPASPGRGVWPQAWTSDLAPPSAWGVGAPGPSPPGFEDALQVFPSFSLFSADLRFTTKSPGRIAPGCPSTLRSGPGWCGWVPGERGSARRRPVRSSGVSY